MAIEWVEWQYKVVTTPASGSALGEEISEYGQYGWELIQIEPAYPDHLGKDYIFKRPGETI